MIQFKRGKTSSWSDQKKPLADGHPGYDKERKKIKIGYGKDMWNDLPDASGLRLDEILDSEADAIAKRKGKSAIGSFLTKLLSIEDRPVITYGTESPDDKTVGQVYLQYYDSDPEVDYVISSGNSSIWKFRKWRSGRAECYGTLDLSTTVQESVAGLYSDANTMSKINYPFSFASVPSEVATIQSKGGLVWLACRSENTKSQSALYTVISPDKQTNTAVYKINLSVSGFWK
jgi:hypothetical protein